MEIWVMPEDFEIGEQLLNVAKFYKGEQRKEAFANIKQKKPAMHTAEFFGLEIGRKQSGPPVHLICDEYQNSSTFDQVSTDRGIPISRLNAIQLIDSLIDGYGLLELTGRIGEIVSTARIKELLHQENRSVLAYETPGMTSTGRRIPSLASIFKAGAEMEKALEKEEIAAHPPEPAPPAARIEPMPERNTTMQQEMNTEEQAAAAIEIETPSANHVQPPAAAAIDADEPEVEETEVEEYELNEPEAIEPKAVKPELEEPEMTEPAAIEPVTPKAKKTAKRIETYEDIPFDDRFGTRLAKERLDYSGVNIAKGELSEEKFAEKIREKATNAAQKKVTGRIVSGWESGNETVPLPDEETYRIMEAILIDDNFNVPNEDKINRKQALYKAYKTTLAVHEKMRNNETPSWQDFQDIKAFSKCLQQLKRDEDDNIVLPNNVIAERINAKISTEIEEVLQNIPIDSKFILRIQAGDYIPSEGLKRILYDILNVSEDERPGLNAAYLRSKAASEQSKRTKTFAPAEEISNKDAQLIHAVKSAIRAFFVDDGKPLTQEQICKLDCLMELKPDPNFWSALMGKTTNIHTISDIKKEGLNRAVKTLYAGHPDQKERVLKFKQCLKAHQDLSESLLQKRHVVDYLASIQDTGQIALA